MLIGDLITEVCQRFAIGREELLGKSKCHAFMPARYALYKILHKRGLSFTHVGKICGGRDHKTIIKGIDRAHYMMERNPEYTAIIDDLASRRIVIAEKEAA